MIISIFTNIAIVNQKVTKILSAGKLYFDFLLWTELNQKTIRKEKRELCIKVKNNGAFVKTNQFKDYLFN